jgi:hypothetical protein
MDDDKWLSDFDAYAEKFSTHKMHHLIEELRSEIVHNEQQVKVISEEIRTTRLALVRWEVKYKERLESEGIK